MFGQLDPLGTWVRQTQISIRSVRIRVEAWPFALDMVHFLRLSCEGFGP